MDLIHPDLSQYATFHSTAPSALAQELMEYTQKHIHGAQMLIGPLEASLLSLIIKLKSVKTILELGTYTGYSALIMAEALPHDGQVTTIDINPCTIAVAKKFWDMSQHAHKITSILKPGQEALKDLQQSFDLIFIDADKNNYSHYLHWATQHLNPGGVIISDNVLWSGKVLRPGLDKQTDSIIEHNKLALSLEGFHKTLLPIRDGMYVLHKLK